MPDGLSVDKKELAFSIGSDSQSVKVTSGSRWDVNSKPEWISLQSINRSEHTPYEWTVNFNAAANDDYNREGVIVFKANAETVDVAVTQDGKKGKYVPVDAVSISPTELTLTEEEISTLTYTISPSNASVKEVSWESSSPSVATVSQDGKVEAIAEGTALITVTTKDGEKKASCNVTVTAKKISVTGVSLDKMTLSLTEGETATLTATVSPSNATDKSVTWSSSNTSVATVSSSGVVTAKAAGSATITVTTTDGGKTATCAVTVNAAKVSLVIDVASPGSLCDYLDLSTLDSISSLVLSGQINGTDIILIRRMSNLLSLDLFDATICSGGQAYRGGFVTGDYNIGEEMFFGMESLQSVVTPKNCTYIAHKAFYNCYNLSKVKLNEGIVSIGDWAFLGCSLREIVFPSSLSSLGNQTFKGCPIRDLFIPSSLTYLGSNAFNSNEYLETIKFESSTPPTGFPIFYGHTYLYETVILYVPSGSSSAYIRSSWGEFKNIVEY